MGKQDLWPLLGAIPFTQCNAVMAPIMHIQRGRETSHHPTHPTTRLYDLFSATADSSVHELILPSEDEGFVIEHRRLKDVFTYDVKPGGEDNARQEEVGWKFLVDVGEGVRMRERMASGALVFRPLLLGDWITEHSVPWVHYVPVQVRVLCAGAMLH